MPGWTWGLAGLAALVLSGAGLGAEDRLWSFPQLARYGGIVRLPNAAEPPRQGAKIVFDITADSQPDELNQGLESVARYLNLNAEAGFKPSDIQLAVVLHGAATKAALQDSAYARHTPAASNPNLELIRQLRSHGVEVFVCGQSLARNKLATTEVAGEVSVAVSAMTVNVNKQQDGYSYLSLP